ncbi:AfsR/SARP family transcriptional regulator [Actinorugispora endophytica]|nr:BTAD domain-containing putative transcriptional regulator [Actinorugispora endophytica]
MRYRILGGVEVRDAERVLHVGGPKRRTVLAALLMRANQVVTDEDLIDRTWGDRPPAKARAQLQVHVSELRSLLGRQTILRRPPGYTILTRPGEVDRDRFESLAGQAREAREAGRVDTAITALRDALALWTGPALGGVEPALADIGRPALDDLRAAAVEELYDAELARGRGVEVVGELRQLLGEFPHRERLCGHLMLALHRADRTAEALEVYASLRTRLAEELGIEPGESVQELQRCILRGGVAAVGQGRAHDRTSVVCPAELPHDIPGFVARRAELDLLDASLGQAERDPGEGPKIWVVSGAAGVGKTALALHWAHSVVDRFPDGQLYIDLRGFSARHAPMEPATALRALLRGLGSDPRNLPRDTGELARFYRSRLAGRRICVVLDNAATADQVAPLLPGHSGSTVLVTSRRRLAGLTARHGARPVPLGALSPGHSVELLARLLGADAVAAEPEAAAELAEVCGHLPLVLRLAAANAVTAGPPPDIGAMVRLLRSDDGLAGLSAGGDEAVAADFSPSHRSLTVDQARFFRRLVLAPRFSW